MRPDAEFGVTEPVRNLVGLQRFPRWQEGALRCRLLRTRNSRKRQSGTRAAHPLQHFPAIHLHVQAYLSGIDASNRVEFKGEVDRDRVLYSATTAAIAARSLRSASALQ